MKRVLGLVLLLVLAFAGITWAALEVGGGVAVVDTRTADGSRRSTHLWFVDEGGTLWLEAGSQENGWYRDVLRDPVLNFHAEGRVGRYVAEPDRDPARFRWLRKQMAAKYGWRDRWVALFVDRDQSVAVRLALRRDADETKE